MPRRADTEVADGPKCAAPVGAFLKLATINLALSQASQTVIGPLQRILLVIMTMLIAVDAIWLGMVHFAIDFGAPIPFMRALQPS